jgi:hypothetical protein
MFNGLLRKNMVHGAGSRLMRVFAILKLQMWQWQAAISGGAQTVNFA